MNCATTKARPIAQAARPRHRLGLRQDRRPRRQGPEGALRRRHQRLRGRPDAALSSPAEARLQQHLRQGATTIVSLGRVQAAIDAGKLDAGADGRCSSADQGRRRSAAPRTACGFSADGELTAKLTFDVAGASKPPIEKVEKAGGSVNAARRSAEARTAVRAKADRQAAVRRGRRRLQCFGGAKPISRASVDYVAGAARAASAASADASRRIPAWHRLPNNLPLI